MFVSIAKSIFVVKMEPLLSAQFPPLLLHLCVEIALIRPYWQSCCEITISLNFLEKTYGIC